MRLVEFFKKYKKNNYTYVIAEACDNHFGKINNAYKMIDQAKDAGADCIKFQHHLPDEEMLKNVPKSKNFDLTLYSFLKKYSLKIEDHIKLKKYCENKNIQYLCTPFSYKAAYDLYKYLKVDCFKSGSGELLDIPSLLKISKFKKPMILSTGMSTEKEIKFVYQKLKNKTKIIFMHCLSEYPTDYSDLNLSYISNLKKIFKNNIIGYSDHTNNIFTPFVAVAFGARIIEKHVTLNLNHKGPDKDVSIDFNQLKDLIKGLRTMQNSYGCEKKIHNKEKIIRSWAHRSIVSIQDIKKGDLLSEKNIWTKRPGTGIPAIKFDKILGKKSIRFIKKNKLISLKDF